MIGSWYRFAGRPYIDWGHGLMTSGFGGSSLLGMKWDWRRRWDAVAWKQAVCVECSKGCGPPITVPAIISDPALEIVWSGLTTKCYIPTLPTDLDKTAEMRDRPLTYEQSIRFLCNLALDAVD